MITLEPDYTRGAVRIFGPTPNGAMTVVRRVAGMPDVLVRGGAYTVTASGLVLLDTEAPYSVDLYYDITVSGITTASRLIQQNLMLTPTFTHGIQGWLAGSGRPLVITSDPTAHSPVVGHVGPVAGGTAPAAAPTFVGHVDSGPSVNAPYTLTPPTTGGTAVATNDQMLLVHEQLASASIPSVTAGWTPLSQRVDGPVRRFIWQRKRVAGDAGVTVSVPAGSNSIGTLLWVRGAIDEILLSTDLPPTDPAALVNTVTTVGRSVLRGHLGVAVLNGYTQTAQPLPTTASLSGGSTWRYTVGPATGQRSVTIATSSDIQAGNIPSSTLTFGDLVTGGGAVDVIFQAAGTFPLRVIARGKFSALAATSTPYLFTGRVRYVTLGLWTWADVLAQGTWQHLKDTKSTWLDVRGGDSVIDGGFTKLFLTIVDPVTGNDYITPQQILAGADTQVNTWLDFSAVIPAGVAIPDTAEMRLLHGNAVKEYNVDWYLDEFGITPGDQIQNHNTLYWFDGDSPVPADTPARLYPDGAWTAVTADASAVWSGTAGNSISTLYAPSSLRATSVTYLTLPEDVRVPSEPVLLSDPLDMDLWCWVGLLEVGDLTHPVRQAIFQVINRPDSVANSQVRSWETGELRVLTHTLQERDRFLNIASSGRVLILRNPNTNYPENNWYLAIGDITESRVIPNARKYERAWVLPYVRVAQPVSAPSNTPVRNTWLDVRGVGTWAAVRTRWDSWQDVLTDEA